ncbi:BamA/TamA family outer membrane protein [Balneolaceae bacterium ANBcel3]|nr:BamA/TamA family outer membrane protein [Balneolaceae bacterium ANBcel3]
MSGLCRKTLCILFFTSLFAVSVKAQIPGTGGIPSQDTVATSILPAVVYTSDLGLLGAVLYNRVRYDTDVLGAGSLQPYINSTELSAELSTKALAGVRFVYEQRETFDLPIRSRWSVKLQHDPAELFFGIGNDTPFEKSDWDSGYYDFGIYLAELSWRGRSTWYRSSHGNGYIDFIALTEVSYQKPKKNEDRLFDLIEPFGYEGGWLNMIGAGLLWENRDNEVAASRGSRFEVTASYSPGLLLSDFHMLKLAGDYRQYITLPVPYFYPVLAGRVAGEWTTGDVPFWKLPFLGDQYTLRGYPWYRFRGDASVYYNLELRTWLYQFNTYNIRLGVHGFHDAGRVFSVSDDFSDIMKNHHRTVGAGVAVSAFSPYLIFRMDFGFSEDMFRLYMNMGYMF